MTDRENANIFIGLITSTPKNRELIKTRLEKYGFSYSDLSGDEYSKEHVRFMIGGKSEITKDEKIYSFDFPERPGALLVINLIFRFFIIEDKAEILAKY